MSAADISRYRELFERSADPILIIDGDTFVDCNQATVDILRYKTREELLQMNILDLKPIKQAELFLKSRKTIIKKGSYLFDSEYITKGGDIVPVEINSRVLEFNGETVILSISRNEKYNAKNTIRQQFELFSPGESI